MYFSRSGRFSICSSVQPKFLASTCRGVCAKKSLSRKVLFSENAPSSKTSRNCAPSSNAWMLCGTPCGKNHRSPAFTSSMKLRPSWSTALIRQLPLSMYAHSDCWCQWISRYAPGSRPNWTPDN
jgi:hypothetical protein